MKMICFFFLIIMVFQLFFFIRKENFKNTLNLKKLMKKDIKLKFNLKKNLNNKK